MVVLKFNVRGHTQMARNIRIFVDDLQRLGEFFAEALDIVTARSDALFAAQGSNVEKANAWPPLAASTLKARERRWGYYKRAPSRPSVLRWTGNLQENRERHVTDRSGKLTYRAGYGVYHQDGGGKLPRRVVVDLSNKTNMEIVKALQRKIHKDIGIFGRQA